MMLKDTTGKGINPSHPRNDTTRTFDNATSSSSSIHKECFPDMADCFTKYSDNTVDVTANVDTQAAVVVAAEPNRSPGEECVAQEPKESAESIEPDHQQQLQQSQKSPASVAGGGPCSSWNEWDVPIGRAQNVHDFIGNVRYRNLVQQHKQEYQEARQRSDKAHVSVKIYDVIKSNGGRFLVPVGSCRSSKNNEADWQETSKDKALAKIRQAMRMATRRPSGSQSSSQSKSCRTSLVLLPTEADCIQITVPPRDWSASTYGPPREIQIPSPNPQQHVGRFKQKKYFEQQQQERHQQVHPTQSWQMGELGEPEQHYCPTPTTWHMGQEATPPLLIAVSSGQPYSVAVAAPNTGPHSVAGEFSEQQSLSQSHHQHHAAEEWFGARTTYCQLNDEDLEPLPFHDYYYY